MPQSAPGNGSYVASRVETILSVSRWSDEFRIAADELFGFLCENPHPPPHRQHKVPCLVAVDTGNECLEEIIRVFLPEELRPRSPIVAHSDMPAVIRMLRDDLPALLVLNSNFLLMPSTEVLAGCVAVSPGTRYLILTTWNEESVEQLRKKLAPLRVPFYVLVIPCDRQQFVAALANIVTPAQP